MCTLHSCSYIIQQSVVRIACSMPARRSVVCDVWGWWSILVSRNVVLCVMWRGRWRSSLNAGVVGTTANRFEVLHGEKTRYDVVYMGDSIVKKIHWPVCSGRKEKTTTGCLPVDTVDDVRKRVGQVMGPGTGGLICVHVGTNDADKEGTTAIVNKFRELVRELKARRVGRILISGILPVMGGRKRYRNCRRVPVNSQLERMCI